MRTFEVLGPLLEWLNCSTNRGELDCTDKIVKNGVIYYLKDHSGECHVCFHFLRPECYNLCVLTFLLLRFVWVALLHIVWFSMPLAVEG